MAALLGALPRFQVLGLYGLEDRTGVREGALGPAPADVTAEVERAAALVPGARVEHQGPQVATHYRGASDPDAARRILVERLGDLAERHGFRVPEGKKVVELAAGTAHTKGDAVRDLVRREGLRRVLYAGADVADLEAFRTIEQLAAEVWPA